MVYNTVSATNTGTLVKKVNEYLEAGWQLYGNLIALQDEFTPVFVQAIVKYDKEIDDILEDLAIDTNGYIELTKGQNNNKLKELESEIKFYLENYTE